MSRGQNTRGLILDRAVRTASLLGLDQITVGELAKHLKLSKSGLFAHFGSKEQLQISVLREAAERFANAVVLPAIKQPRGEPRVRALYENWLAWSRSDEMPGGCVFISAAVEFDSRPGNVRDYVVHTQREWYDVLVRAATISKEAGHFRGDLNEHQFAFDLQGITLSSHHHQRLLHSPDWEDHSRQSFERLVRSARN